MKRCPVVTGGGRQEERATTTRLGTELNRVAVDDDESSTGGPTVMAGEVVDGRGAGALSAAAAAAAVPAINQGLKSIEELGGPPGWPIVGNFLTYLKKENRGKMHEVQVGGNN